MRLVHSSTNSALPTDQSTAARSCSTSSSMVFAPSICSTPLIMFLEADCEVEAADFFDALDCVVFLLWALSADDALSGFSASAAWSAASVAAMESPALMSRADVVVSTCWPDVPKSAWDTPVSPDATAIVATCVASSKPNAPERARSSDESAEAALNPTPHATTRIKKPAMAAEANLPALRLGCFRLIYLVAPPQ